MSRKMEEYNDQETDKISKKCWGKKAAYAYAGLMLTACILTYKLYFASGSNIFKSEEEKASVASSVAEGKIAYGEKIIIQGDITDRNDTVIMTSDAVDGYAHYKDAEAYTQAIGFASKNASYLLGKKRVRHGYMMRFRVQIRDVRFRQHWIRMLHRNIVYR